MMYRPTPLLLERVSIYTNLEAFNQAENALISNRSTYQRLC